MRVSHSLLKNPFADSSRRKRRAPLFARKKSGIHHFTSGARNIGTLTCLYYITVMYLKNLGAGATLET